MTTAPMLAFDHLAITSHKLSSGMDYIRRVFGVEIPLGGQHHFMGTHNAVMAVGDGIYIEVIAIDPSLPVPPYPRWFGLGNAAFEDRLKDQPLLTHYVLRTPDIDATLAALSPQLREKLGPVHKASRGDLSWKITIHESGLPPEGGCLPALIEWNGKPPQYDMTSPGPQFDRLHLCHPDLEGLTSNLTQMGAGDLMANGLICLEKSAVQLKADFNHRNKSIFI